MVDMLLVQCSHLLLLLVCFPDYTEHLGHRWVEDAPVKDARFVATSYTDYPDDWEAAAKGLPDTWSLADDFVSRKRRGEIADAERGIGDSAFQAYGPPTSKA
ncbi:hypothetical protein B0H15DRAFT_799422 [Mycena belliarum]|uniref:Uncharacterized protein n=1 Tax=Mycena belliarum TaxID=1033014 RepID=A0AAD6XPA7_9AGAR|nr:hypothetical protein B0H15DRAFT_799422 [Mycena belliae]